MIVPDGILGYVPYEALLTQMPNGDDKDYHKLSYLIRDFQINYAYSATLLYDSMTKEKRKRGVDYVGFAPVTFK